MPGVEDAAVSAWRRVAPGSIRVPLPHVPQRDAESCGPAVLVSVLGYYHVDLGGLDRARKQLRTTEEGTTPERLERLARASGLRVKAGEGWALGDVTDNLDAGRPVIVLIRAHGNEGHYAAAVGHDRRNVVVMDPLLDAFYGYVEKSAFPGRWWDVRPGGARVERWAMACWKARPWTRRALPVPW